MELRFISASYLTSPYSGMSISLSGSVRFFTPHVYRGLDVRVMKVAKVWGLKRKKKGPPAKKIQRGFEDGHKKI
jgi:hypothetical protein